MNLLLDFGNHRCKFAMLDKDGVIKYGVQSYPKKNRHLLIESLLHEYKVSNKVIISSVLDEKFKHKLIKLLNSHTINEYYFLDPATNSFGIQLDYLNPGQLGADRLAALIAADEKFRGNTCVIDCGTAITIDALSANHVHRGGVIFPGLASMQLSLNVDTDIKYHEAEKGNFNIVADTTQDAIYTGCFSAVIGGVQYVVNTMQAHYDSFDQVIITGGDAELMMPMLTQKVAHEPTLVVDGLSVVYRKL